MLPAKEEELLPETSSTYTINNIVLVNNER